MKTALPHCEITSHFIRRPDGARLRVFDTGGNLPVVLLANGLGGPLSALRTYIHCLSTTHRVATWDYRGLYGSTLGPRSELDVGVHASDAAAVADHIGAQKVGWIGWSMGVQVGLELYRQAPERISRLVLMNGTFGRPLGRFPLPLAGRVLPHLIGAARRLHWLGRPLVRGLRSAPGTGRMLKQLGLIAEGFDERLLNEVLTDFHDIDFKAYLDILGRLGEHDAEAVLPQVRVPTLVITGSRDLVTPTFSARRMAQTIPGAEFFVLQGASHYAAAEYPERVLARIRLFFAKHEGHKGEQEGT